MRFIIDRIEGGFAVCEDENRNMSDIPLLEFPFEVNAGDIIEYSADGFKRLENETEERKAKLKERFDNLFE